MIERYFATGGAWSPELALLNGLRGPAGAPTMAVGTIGSVYNPQLIFEASSQAETLRLTVAIEAREPKTLQVLAAESGEVLAEEEVNFADPYQVLDIILSPEAADLARVQGVKLQLSVGTAPLWLFSPAGEEAPVWDGYSPHFLLVQDESPIEQAVNRLNSFASLQTFSWKEGCVLDGLLELQDRLGLETRSTILDHLNFYGYESGDLVYEDPRNRPLRNQINTIETTLVFVAAARENLDHPWIPLVENFWRGQIKENGTVIDHEMISAEGAYTVAYPMALIGRLKGDGKLQECAANLLRTTRDRLNYEGALYLRHFRDDRRTHRNWIRGYSWYLLGHVQTLRNLPESGTDDIREEFLRAAKLAASMRNSKSLWNCFADEAGVEIDTAGSSGVAAAFALGAKEGYLPAEFKGYAEEAYASLQTYLTPDGFLKGCSQSNKAGEELQRGPYRVISTYALGLLGILHGVLQE